MDLMLAKWQLYVQSKMGLRNCQMDIDTPPYGVVTSLLALVSRAFYL